jgi:RNA polymerase sigma-70 factor, ECF subfamily
MDPGWGCVVSRELAFDFQLAFAKRNTAALRQKVSEAFDLLRDPVYRYLFRVLDNPGDAEDLTQEVFLRLYSHLHEGGAVGNVRAWVFRVAHNLAIDQQRKKVRLEPMNASTSDQTRDPAPCAEETVLLDERHRRLQRALDQLSTDEKHCLELRAEGLSYQEIADILEMRLPTTAKYVGRIIKKLVKEAACD